MKQKKGFTLVELLIVIAIISLLALLGGANYIQSLKRGRDARRKGDLEQVRAALEMYRTDNANYPIYADNTDADARKSNYDSVVDDLLADDYLTKDIIGPQGEEYEYLSDATGVTYTLCADLELEAGDACTDWAVVNP